MWIVRGILFLGLLFVLVYFFLANSGQSVDLNLFGRQYLDIPLYWILSLAFLLGLAASFVVAAVREIRLQARLRQLRRKLEAKEREIAELRALPLDGYRDEAARAEEAGGD